MIMPTAQLGGIKEYESLNLPSWLNIRLFGYCLTHDLIITQVLESI
jgi:hypothetical protein